MWPGIPSPPSGCGCSCGRDLSPRPRPPSGVLAPLIPSCQLPVGCFPGLRGLCAVAITRHTAAGLQFRPHPTDTFLTVVALRHPEAEMESVSWKDYRSICTDVQNSRATHRIRPSAICDVSGAWAGSAVASVDVGVTGIWWRKRGLSLGDRRGLQSRRGAVHHPPSSCAEVHLHVFPVGRA